MRKLLTFLSLMFLVSACGSAPKHVQASKSGGKGNHAKRSGQSYVPMYGDDTSLEDIIYDSLGSKKGSGIRYSQYVEQNGKFDIPIVYNDAVQKWIDYFTGPGREHFERYLSRSGRFIPYMHTVLLKYNLPKDLVYLSMIESGFNSRAMSFAAAGGLWQFIRSTGALYGLNADYYVDERADVEKATDAAARHLKDLYDEFGHWYLAFAAYNAGAGKVRNAIARDGNDFWDMARGSYLRQETKDYVPKILAAAIIAKSPGKYGFTRINYQLPIDYERVRMKSATDLEVAADCSGVDPDLIRLLNPELLRDMTPPNVPNYSLKIPRGTKDRFERKYASLSPSDRLKTTEYRVTRGDTLRDIASNYGVSEKDLINENPDKIDTHRESGSRVERVPGRHGKYVTKKVHYTVASYSVSPGTTLVIPKNRSVARNASSRDDAAAHAAKGQYGLRLADVEDDVKKGKKDKNKDKNKDKKKNDKETQLAQMEDAPPSRSAPAKDLSPSPAKAPVQSDLDPSLYNEGSSARDSRVAEAPSANSASDIPSGPAPAANDVGNKPLTGDAGTPMAFNDKPDGVSPSTGGAEAPTDAQLKEAVDKVKSEQNSDLAPGDSVADKTQEAPEQKKWVPAEEMAKKPIYHLVKAGETLAGIASKYGVSIADLKEWNGKKVVPNVKKGTKILVAQASTGKRSAAAAPERPTRVAAEEKPTKAAAKTKTSYKVKPGDSLQEIADANGVSAADLKRWNGSKVSPVLLKGATIKLTGPEDKTATKVAAKDTKASPKDNKVAATKPAAKGTPTKVAKAKVIKYKVKPGDSLITIARQHSTTAEEIQKLNGLKSPKIVPGAVLVVQDN